MVRVCSICVRSWNNYSNRTFHQFPHNDETLKKKWIKALELDESKINKYFYVCSDHFDKSCYTVCMKNRTLIKGSVPSKKIVAADKSDQIQRPRFTTVLGSNFSEPFDLKNRSAESVDKLPTNYTSLSEAAKLAKKKNLARKNKVQSRTVQKVICKTKPTSSPMDEEKTQNVLLYNVNHYTCIDYKQVKKLGHQKRSKVPIKGTLAPARQVQRLIQERYQNFSNKGSFAESLLARVIVEPGMTIKYNVSDGKPGTIFTNNNSNAFDVKVGTVIKDNINDVSAVENKQSFESVPSTSETISIDLHIDAADAILEQQNVGLDDCTSPIDSTNSNIIGEISETSNDEIREINSSRTVNCGTTDETLDFYKDDNDDNQSLNAEEICGSQCQIENCENEEKKSKNLLVYRVNHYTCINYEQIKVVPPEELENSEQFPQLEQQPKNIPKISSSGQRTVRKETISPAKNIKKFKTIINRKRKKNIEEGEIGYCETVESSSFKKKRMPASSSKINGALPCDDPNYTWCLGEGDLFTDEREENDRTALTDEEVPVRKKPYRTPNKPNRTQFVSNEGYNTFIKFANLQSKTIGTITKNLAQSFKRKQERVKRLKKLIEQLKNESKESVIAEEYQELPQLIKEILNRTKNINSRENISAFLLDFAKTVYNSSPATYEILRNEFIYCLPHPNTISNHTVKEI